MNSNKCMLASKNVFKLIFLSCICWSIGAAEPSKTLKVIFDSPTKMALPYKINLSGTFNQWQMNKLSQMTWNPLDKQYQFSIPTYDGLTFFNIHKDGDWQNPMTTEFGKPFTCGYILEPGDSSKFKPDFYGWAKDSEKAAPETVVGNLITLENFQMTLLNRTGDIYIYLPKGYQEDTKKQYPVAYMLDGQNLFSESLSYSHEWQVDETLTALKLDVIVVGISNGPERWQEYSPWDGVDIMGESLKGKGVQTIQFIKQQLKPYIDNNYRTLKAPENTAILGSSLGGLMALYGAFEHSETFGKAAAFSPSFSFANLAGQMKLAPEQSNLINAAKRAKSNDTTKIYFDVGEVEYGSFELIDTLHESMFNAGYPLKNLKLVKDKRGRHCELDWARRFPEAMTWLFNDK